MSKANKQKRPEKLYGYEAVIRLEKEQLLKRRNKLYEQNCSSKEFDETKFGIALSGGGIRSATINLGLLKTLNQSGLLKRADYLSTVSGGGYTGAYVQATLKQEGDYEALFQQAHLKHMRLWGEYLLPGKGWLKRWNALVLTIGFIMSLLMSWVSPLIIFVLFYITYSLISRLFHFENMEGIRSVLEQFGFIEYGLMVLGSVVLAHFAMNLIMEYKLGISRKFNNVEAFLVAIGLAWNILLLIVGLKEGSLIGGTSSIWQSLIAAGLFILLGFLNNPNALSFHRFYRTQLSDAFLHFAGRHKNVPIKDLFNANSDQVNDYLAPYPLINTCLNLQSSRDKNYSGTKTNDYFLLSPLYCGAKLTNYVNTNFAEDYKDMTLPAATTISAAAVNPGMGIYSNKMLSIFMTVFNARLGFWTHNPLKKSSSSIVWWPFYFFYELFSLIGTDNRKLNISDGGHIENLGVYELLRRKCRLIIAIDAGADPGYTFGDLENLTIRARNELGIEIRFREGQHPESIIRPKPSFGYSEQRYALADIIQLWEEIIPLDENEQPFIDEQKGKPIEVLINYKNVKDAFLELSKKDSDRLVEVLEELQLQDYTEKALNTLTDQNLLASTLGQIQMTDASRNVLFALIEIFTDLKGYLDEQLPKQVADPQKRRDILKFIIRTIDQRVKNKLKTGTLVYVKSSVTAPDSKLHISDKSSLDYRTYKYKVYHPAFPHEPTSDQFFDEVQWESYFKVGQYIGAEVLGKKQTTADSSSPMNFEDLIARFDQKEVKQAPRPVEASSAPPQMAADPAAAEATPIEMDHAAPIPPDLEEAPAKIIIGHKDDYSI